MRRIRQSSFFYSAIVFTILFFSVPIPIHAEDICCKCQPKDMDQPPTLCYTTPTLASGDDCSTLPTEKEILGFTCDKKALTPAQCKKISGDGSGICTQDPEQAKASRKGETIVSEPTAQSAPPPLTMTFNTPIPGFKAPQDMGMLFSTYIVAIYRYMISIAVFVTTVMFIWGAFRYLVGSSMGSVSRGKAIMKDAVIGLLLVLSANLILRTINPQLVTLKNLNISEITYIPIDEELQRTMPAQSKRVDGSCIEATFGSNSKEVASHITAVTFLGDRYLVHAKAAPDFQAAFNELEQVPENSPAGQWVRHMKNMAPYSANCQQGKGYSEKGSRTGGAYDPRLDKIKETWEKNNPGKPYPYTWHMHFLGLAIDLDSCFNPMCQDCKIDPATKTKKCTGIPCSLDDPKWNRIPIEVVNIVEKHNIYWGGYAWKAEGKNWTALVEKRDAMHFEWHGICW